MSALYIALPVALLLALIGVAAFIWSVRTGQMDDLETPALRLLGEDDERRRDGPGEDGTQRQADSAEIR